MAVKPQRRNSWFTVLLLVTAITIWAYNQIEPGRPDTKPGASRTEKSTPPPKARPAPTPQAPGKANGYEVYHGCTLVDVRNNDGDSFTIQLPGGKQAVFRLYFVDTPESAFRRYAGGETNHERIRQQAAEMGGITPEQAVEIGKQGKHFTLGLLASRPFDLYTRWDSPFHDDRFHAHIEVKQDGKTRWLDELLIERGLARIKTKPADLPDGTPASKHLARLKELERAAKRAETGVWGVK